MEFARQGHWNGLPLPAPGYLPDLRIEPASFVFPALQADSLSTEPSGIHISRDVQVSEL